MRSDPKVEAERRRIHLLPPELANRIAAGEVVERPASVIKELCENSLDAGASLLEVDLEGGGQKLLRVRDDGHGIAPDEAGLALERHATSKIHVAADLDAIVTLGFRGEALPSIAAVSRFVLQTRARGDDAGTRVEVHGGGPAEVRAVGCPQGTVIEVRDLFFNVPARRKFLKTAQTEVGHAVEAVSRLALAFPSIDFRVRVDGKEALHAPPVADSQARAAQVLSRDVAAHLYPCDGREGDIAVTGLVGDPSHARGRPDSIYTFVNGRFTRDRVIQHAVQAAYLPVLERGRYPWVVLFVEVPPHLVDVNVHPAKVEVRFADSRPIHRAVEHIVAQSIQRAPWVQGGTRPYVIGGTNEHLARLRESRSRYPTDPPAGIPVDRGSLADVAPAQAPLPSRDLPGARPIFASIPGSARDAHLSWLAAMATGAGAQERPERAPDDAFFSNLRVVGQLHRLYLVCEAPDEIVLVDQHAAHERVLFERLRAGFRAGTVASQPLLFPVTLELPPLEREAAEAYAPELLRIGFELEPFGAGTVALKAAPALLRDSERATVAADLLGELARVGRASALDERVDHLLATLACHSAVRAGDPLTNQEGEALLAQLDQVDFQGNCPHGRPVVLRARFQDLERGFGRR